MGGSILISDRQGRLKPCLRCGYSLRVITETKNCPECGLAVRVSLNGNTGLDWSNPQWQRSLAVAFAVLGAGVLCRTVSSAARWILFLSYDGYYDLTYRQYERLRMVWIYAAVASAMICGIAFCLLARREGRYPDPARGAREIRIGAGIGLVCLALLQLVRGGFPTPLAYVFSRVWYGPWIPVVIGVLCAGQALALGRRGGSRRPMKISQLPLWPSAAGVVIWLMNLDRLFWPLSGIAEDWLFPLSVVAIVVVVVWVLRTGAREAEGNWVTDD